MNALRREHAELVWRGVAENDELNGLHAEAFGRAAARSRLVDSTRQPEPRLVTARKDDCLLGFVNVAWDGLAHAFILDLAVAKQARRCGIGTELIRVACEHAAVAGCQWLHVDFEERLSDFYLGACGFQPTTAGLLAIRLADH